MDNKVEQQYSNHYQQPHYGQQMQMTSQHQPQMMQQQQQQQLMPRPMIPNCPPGLEYLAQLDQLLIKQQKEMIEILIGYERENRYVVQNVLGQQVYFAKESSDACSRQCCGPQRHFELSIIDNLGQEVIFIDRPYKCLCIHQAFSCMDSCFDEVTVEAPRGSLVGKVVQVPDQCSVKYEIRDATDEVVLYIRGPSYCRCYCPGEDIPFTLMSSNGQSEIGKVSRQWSNLLQEYFTDADNFGINFPMDLDVRMKAVVLAACFLIDFMFFERSANDN